MCRCVCVYTCEAMCAHKCVRVCYVCETPSSNLTVLLYRAHREVFLESKHGKYNLNIFRGPLSQPAWVHTHCPGKHHLSALLTLYQQPSPLLTHTAAQSQWSWKVKTCKLHSPSHRLFRSKYMFVLKILWALCVTKSASRTQPQSIALFTTPPCSFSCSCTAHCSRDVLSPDTLSELS